MIAFVEGILVSGGTEAVVAVGGGIGLDVQLSAKSAEKLPAPGDAVRLWTHLAVREDNWALYGFVREQEREMFRLLISVSVRSRLPIGSQNLKRFCSGRPHPEAPVPSAGAGPQCRLPAPNLRRQIVGTQLVGSIRAHGF